MAETIPGGAYKLPDGSFVNAEGKRIAAPRGPVYIRPEEPETISEDQITPGASLLGEDEFGADPDMVTEEPSGRKRVSTRKKS